MKGPVLLLFQFSEGQRVQLSAMLPAGIRVVPVPRECYGMTLADVLNNQSGSFLTYGNELERKMLVLANVPGPMLEFVLDACKQVTGDQPVLRAMLTPTNQAWTGSQLAAHLMEEEAALGNCSK